jgi:hypothetical protein
MMELLEEVSVEAKDNGGIIRSVRLIHFSASVHRAEFNIEGADIVKTVSFPSVFIQCIGMGEEFAAKRKFICEFVICAYTKYVFNIIGVWQPA